MMIVVETLMVLALLAVLQIALASMQQIEQQKTPPRTLEATQKLSLIDIYARIDWEGVLVTLVEFLWLALRVAALLPALLTLELSALIFASHRLIGSALQRIGVTSNTWLLAVYKQVVGNKRGAVKKIKPRRAAAAVS